MYTLSAKARFILTMVLAIPGAAAQQPSAAELIEHRVPAPQLVGTRQLPIGIEIAAPIPFPSIFPTRDGHWMMIGSGKISYSGDKGKTWSKPEVLTAPIDYALRLQSGKLGGPAPVQASNVALGKRDTLYFYTSQDEGRSWSKRGRISVGDVPGSPYPKTMIQTRSGRLILPVRFTDGAGNMGLYKAAGAFGILNGTLTMIEGHAHFPEPDNAFVYYSDDEGETWHRSEGGIMIWLNEGYGGMWPCDEPSVVEQRNEDIVMYCRTSLGRIFTARSGASKEMQAGKVVRYKPGERFDNPIGTVLASSYSPSAIQRIAQTNDLLIVWNQVSGDEIRAGYRRGRLSSAISRDDGKTWEHYRTIDTAVVPPAGRVEPDRESRLARALDFVGELPEDYGGVDYPTINVIGEYVVLCWDRTMVRQRPGDVVGRRMRVLPLSWFYQDEQPLPAGPKLLLSVLDAHGKPAQPQEIPSRSYEGRFYCRLSDVARFLKSPLGHLERDLCGPIEQVVTCLGWSARYDSSKLTDPQGPHLLVLASKARNSQ